MKRLSTIFMTLAFLFGVAGNSVSAKENPVYSLDYSTMADKDGAPFWAPDPLPSGASVKVEDGLLVINNTSSEGNNWDLQLHIADGIPTVLGLNYKVKITYKTTKAGNNVTVALGAWGDGNSVPKYGQTITVNENFQTMSLDFNNFIRTGDNFVMWQCRSVVGTIYIQKVEVIEVTADEPSESVLYGDLKEVDATMYVKNYGAETVGATPDADGVYTATDALETGDTWATQFWIAAPSSLSTGQKFYVEFDYKASNAETVTTQTHGATPGSYIHWACMGDVSFTTEWNHFEKEVNISSDMNGWQSIAFNMHRGEQVSGDTYKGSNTTYSIKNVVLKLPEVLGTSVEFMVSAAGWASFSYNKAVSLGTTKGYAVKAHGTYVELIPVTEVPANNAVLIEGHAKHTFAVIDSATPIADNDLLVSDGSVVGDESTIYALGKNGDEIGFMKVKAGATVPAGKAYLVISGGDAREFIGIGEGETTGIHAVEQEAKVDNQYYNLAGQRVANPQKGVYIVNGKKVVIK